MRQTQPPRTIKDFKFVFVEGESSGRYFKLVLPNGSSYEFTINEIENYMLREFGDDEVFVNNMLAGATNFLRVMLLPKEKHYLHLPEGLQCLK